MLDCFSVTQENQLVQVSSKSKHWKNFVKPNTNLKLPCKASNHFICITATLFYER